MSTINKDNILVTLTKSNGYKVSGTLTPAIYNMNYYRVFGTFECPIYASFAKESIRLTGDPNYYDVKKMVLVSDKSNWNELNTSVIADFNISISTDLTSTILPETIYITFEFREDMPDDLIFNI